MESATQTNVYFLQACQGGPVKIGRSQNVEKRIREIQLGHPFKLRVSLLFEDVDPTFETWLHDRFAGFRLHGEWFDERVLTQAIDEDLLEAFESGQVGSCMSAEPRTITVAAHGTVEKTVRTAGSSGRIFVPKAWVGKMVQVCLVEPIGGGDPDA